MNLQANYDLEVAQDAIGREITQRIRLPAPPEGIGRGATELAVRVGFEPQQGIDNKQLVDSAIRETPGIRQIRCIVTPDYTQTASGLPH